MPAGRLYIRAGGNDRCRFVINRREPVVPIALCLQLLLEGALKVHIGQAKHHGHQKDGQHNADSGHPALSSVNLGGYGHQIKVFFHARLPPNSLRTPSRTSKTRSTPETRLGLWVIMRMVC